MTIQDAAGNLFVTQTSPMIGYIPLETLTGQELTLKIYPFIIEVIRQEDQDNGAQFLERFLEGPQEMWSIIDEKIKSLPTLWSVTDIEDRFLPYLKWIVGWTSVLDYITDELDSDTLRRLIASSVPFWKERGTENSIRDILRLTTAARLRIWNWFDLRYITGETAVGEEHLGYDPWMLSLPGAPNYEENRYNVRIVDDGSLNRKLVRDLVRLTRPSGERVTIGYIGFLDLFLVDDDDSQWSHNGIGTSVVEDGLMKLSAGEDAVISVSGADNWMNYVVTTRVRGECFYHFYRTASTDFYYVHLDITNNALRVGVTLAGTPTVLSSIDMYTTFGVYLDPDLFYSLRVEATPEGSATRIKVYFDANQAFSLSDSTHVQGSVGLLSGSGLLEVDEVELFFNPLETDEIDINS